MRHPIHLAAHRKRRGLTQAQLAEILGKEQPTVQRWEAGKRTPDLEDLGEIADALGVTPRELFDLPERSPLGPTLRVVGEVAAGVWREAYEWPEESWRPFTGRADLEAPLSMRFGLRVVGDSMNELYPHGTIVECLSAFGGAEIAPGKRVVILRRRADLEYEATVKELVEQDGRLWAVPRSTNPTFTAFPLDEDEPDVIETRIIAVVVSSIRPEP